MDIVVDESGVVDVVVYMLYHRVVDILPHRLGEPNGVMDIVVHIGGIVDVGGEPSRVVDGIVDEQSVK